MQPARDIRHLPAVCVLWELRYPGCLTATSAVCQVILLACNIPDQRSLLHIPALLMRQLLGRPSLEQVFDAQESCFFFSMKGLIGYVTLRGMIPLPARLPIYGQCLSRYPPSSHTYLQSLSFPRLRDPQEVWCMAARDEARVQFISIGAIVTM